MTLFLVLALLYLGQLLYVGNRWVSVTGTLLEDARMARMRSTLDWTAKAEEPKARHPLIY